VRSNVVRRHDDQRHFVGHRHIERQRDGRAIVVEANDERIQVLDVTGPS
jgi:hypothetical protein